MVNGEAGDPESPGFRRGLFVGRVAQAAPGGSPGTPGVKTTLSSMPRYGT